ncbi:hypothetical protein GCM10009744_32210 [Kribbella alba]|uniref:Uncharacterized protein n=1 Tax=Kribbella alba TaxID=190197 RepID=A0ABP4R7V4_9ACTN
MLGSCGQFPLGLGVVYLITVRSTMLQREVAPGLLGRVGAVIRLVEWGPGPFGGLAGGLVGLPSGSGQPCSYSESAACPPSPGSLSPPPAGT